MTWQTTDKKRLWIILKLDRCQLETGSTLQFLMDYTEEFDTRNNTTLVADIQTLMTEIEVLRVTNPVVYDGSDRVKRADVGGSMEVEYFEGNSLQTVVETVQSKISQIRNLLDPNQLLLCERSPYARVIV